MLQVFCGVTESLALAFLTLLILLFAKWKLSQGGNDDDAIIDQVIHSSILRKHLSMPSFQVVNLRRDPEREFALRVKFMMRMKRKMKRFKERKEKDAEERSLMT